jgi:hypothetical protein
MDNPVRPVFIPSKNFFRVTGIKSLTRGYRWMRTAAVTPQILTTSNPKETPATYE